jgi:hypothetical protein
MKLDVEQIRPKVLLPKSNFMWIRNDRARIRTIAGIGNVRWLGGVKIVHDRPQRVRPKGHPSRFPLIFGIE